MPFQPVNEIERLLVAATRDPAARPDFYRALTECDLLVISDAQQPTDEQLSASGGKTEIQIQLVDVQGKPHVPIFTSKERIAAVVKGETRFLAMNGRALFTMLGASEIVMNPGAEYGKLFTNAEVQSILDGSILQLGPTQNLGGQQVLLSQPAEYPRHITDALSQFFPKHPQVNAVYLAQAQFPKSDASPHTMIGIDMTGDWKSLVGEAGLVAQSVARPGEIIDFMQISNNPDEGVSKYMRSVTPFYQR
jgi:hypothetical protein